MNVPMTPALLQELISYDPESGLMVWRARQAQVYHELVPGLNMDGAEKRATRFNQMWAGRVVGTDQVYRSVNRRVRVSLGPGLTPVRKNSTTVAWMLGAGEDPAPGREVITWDGDPLNLSADNIVETTVQVRRILENPESGLTERADGRWTWLIRNDNERLRGTGEGYETKAEARAARDAQLRDMGLLDIRKLSDVINGKTGAV